MSDSNNASLCPCERSKAISRIDSGRSRHRVTPRNDTMYGHLAAVFDFPGPAFAAGGRTLVHGLRDTYHDAATEAQRFLDGIPERPLDQQELYIRTFDVQSITTLDIGYVLFGDDYKRAALLSHLTREHRQAENDCQGELADHLPNMLRLLPLLADAQLAEELVGEILVPALLLMIREFDSDRIEKKNVSYRTHYKTLITSAPGDDPTIYRRALTALLYVLREDFAVSAMMEKLNDWSRRGPSADFLGLVEREMEIETTANPVNSGGDS